MSQRDIQTFSNLDIRTMLKVTHTLNYYIGSCEKMELVYIFNFYDLIFLIVCKLICD